MPPKTYKKQAKEFSETEKKEMIRRVLAGESMAEVARIYNASCSTLWTWCKAADRSRALELQKFMEQQSPASPDSEERSSSSSGVSSYGDCDDFPKKRKLQTVEEYEDSSSEGDDSSDHKGSSITTMADRDDAFYPQPTSNVTRPGGGVVENHNDDSKYQSPMLENPFLPLYNFSPPGDESSDNSNNEEYDEPLGFNRSDPEFLAAMEHGEKFLKWLTEFGKPRVTEAQISFVRRLIDMCKGITPVL